MLVPGPPANVLNPGLGRERSPAGQACLPGLSSRVVRSLLLPWTARGGAESQEGRGGRNGWLPVQTPIPCLWQHPALHLSPGLRSLPVLCLLHPVVRGKLSPHPGTGDRALAACSGGVRPSLAVSGRIGWYCSAPHVHAPRAAGLPGLLFLQERTS